MKTFVKNIETICFSERDFFLFLFESCCPFWVYALYTRYTLNIHRVINRAIYNTTYIKIVYFFEMTEMRRWIRGMRNSAEQTIAQQQHGQERILSDNMLLSGVLYRSKR